MIVPEGDTAEERLAAFGVVLLEQEDRAVVDQVIFASPADKQGGIYFDDEVSLVRKPVASPDRRLLYIPALLMIGLVLVCQRKRLNDAA